MHAKTTTPSPSIVDDMTPADRRKMIRWSLGGIALLAVAFLIAQGQHQTASSPERTETAPAAHGERIPVQVAKPVRRDMALTLTLPANISPWYQATLYGKVSGYVKWIGFDKGDTVKEGQLLAVIDAPEIEDQYRQAEADYEIKKVTYERYLGVWKENPDIIAKQDVDVAKATAEAAKHLRDSRRTLLQYTKVYAPFSGTITARFVDPGALIQAATGSATQAVPLFTIMDLTTLRVYVSVPQEAALFAKPGVPVLITAKEVPGKQFKATITRTTEALDPATRTLLVEVDLPNPRHELQPGMFVTATLSLQEHKDALAIPPAAIVSGQEDKAVFVVDQGKARRTPIKTGIDDGIWVEVLEGLTGNEDVVVVGKAKLNDGATVAASAYNLPAGQPASQKL